MENKKIVTAAVISLVIGLLIGFWGGSTIGKTGAEKELLPLVNLAFPKPGDDIRSFTGTVKAVVGATITLETSDPSDYLPHLDGSPRATQVRYANITPDTRFVIISNGNVTTNKSSISDIKTGDTITVRSDANIKDTQRFDVTEVDLVR